MDKKKLVLSAAIGAAVGVATYQVGKYIRKSQGRKKTEKAVPHKQGFYEKYLKRPFDVCCASAALVVLSPVMAVTAVLVRIKLGSPVIFTQERPGLNGKIFKLYKFRTMTDERDENGELLPDEKRLTKFGARLRSLSIDELPELWNILRGDAAVCGPRPLLTVYLSRYNEHQARRHEVRPGLTGYAQVHGRNSISWEEKFDMDVWYVDHVSFLTDVKIILETVKTVLSREGISSDTSATMEYFTGTPETGTANDQ
jgi:undecaprenyl phosphate N,N'-diacetylbacillosamine 1-phosphate transferase